VVVIRRSITALNAVLLWVMILPLAALRFGSHTTGPSGANFSLRHALPDLYRRDLRLLLPLRVVVVLDNRQMPPGFTSRRGGRRSDHRGSGVRPQSPPTGRWFPVPPYIFGLLILAIDPKKRRLGDMLAGTHRAR
jgi:uncharacterized RDD family membrane protein YckC